MSKLTDIEQKYPVEKIEVNGIKIWPWLRTYIGSNLLLGELNYNSSKTRKISALLLSVFYGFKPKKKINHLIFSAASQRKNINGIFTDRMDTIVDCTKSAHIYESPIPHHHSNKSIPNKNISSKMPFILREQLLSRTLKVKIDGLDIIEKIMSDYEIKIPYARLCSRFVAQTLIMQKLIKKNSLKSFFLITPYTNMGYVYVAKKHNIPVIEIQHGVINKKHYAYNVSKPVNNDLYPDYMLTWGEYITENFVDTFYINRDNIVPVGNFYIDKVYETFEPDINLTEKLKKYKRSIGFTAQNVFERETIPVIIETANKYNDVAIVYIPRDKNRTDYGDYNFPDNIIFTDELNFYSIIQHCDYHCTISSSCALEAPALGKGNLFYNFGNRALNYYGEILNSPNDFFNNFEDLITHCLKTEPHSHNDIKEANSYLIKKGFNKNVEQFIKDKLS